MSAKYDFRKLKNVNDNGQTTILYPKLVSGGTVSWERIVEEVAHSSSFDPGTIVGVMREIEHRVLWHLGDGCRVQVGNMCYAEPTVVTDREVTDESEIHAQSVRFGKVNLQPVKTFRPQGQLERATMARKFGHSSSRFTEEERYDLLTAYLQEHTFITRAQYGELTGLLRSNALRELNRWVAERRLDFSGKAPHKMYKIMEIKQ